MSGFCRKILTAGLAIALALSTAGLTACKGKNDPSATMSVLNIHLYNGGLGRDWLDAVAAEFTDTFKEVSFEEGKTGVYIQVTADKQLESATLMSTGADKNDIFYTADHDLYEYINLEVPMDITDIVTENVYDSDGNLKLNATGDGWETQTTSLYDRMLPYFQDAYNVAGKYSEKAHDGKLFYGIPFEDSISGIVLDYDLYSSLVKMYRLEMTGYKYSGDEVAMPGTWDEFFTLLDRIRTSNNQEYSSFIYAVDYYTSPMQTAILADVEGDEFMNTLNRYEGSYDFGNGEVRLDSTNMYEILKADGYRKAVEVGVKLFSTTQSGVNHYDQQIMQGVSYGGAQQSFVMSKESTSGKQRILSILEGDWWENEARASFNSMGNLNPANGYGKRNFRMMPIPHFTAEEVSSGKTYKFGGFSSGYPAVVNRLTVEGNPVKEKLVRLWLQFQHSRESLKTFTTHSGSSLAYDYELTEEELSALTPFARSIVEVHQQDVAEDGKLEIVRSNVLALSDVARLHKVGLGFKTLYNSTLYDSEASLENLRQIRSAGNSWVAGSMWLSSEEQTVVNNYLNGMYNYYKSEWTK